MKTNQTTSRVSGILKRTLLFVALAVALLGAFTGQGASPINLIVAYDGSLYYSAPVWDVVTQTHKLVPLPFEIVPAHYRSTNLNALTSALATNGGAVLVLGPANSENAAQLDQIYQTRSNVTVFVSPTISTSGGYSNLPLVGACLSDRERIASLSKTAPRAWSELPAAFVGVKGKWGEELYQHLASSSNLAHSVKPFYVEPESSDYQGVISKCKEGGFAVLFLALSDSVDVKGFLHELDNRNTTLSPYSPMICLLGDYLFTNTTIAAAVQSKVISVEWANRYCISMASEAVLGRESDVYAGLTSDLLAILRQLHAENADSPHAFFEDIKLLFSGNRGEAKRLLSHVTVTNSHYYKFLGGTELSEAELKWLRPSPLFSKTLPSWQAIKDKSVPFDFAFSVVSSKVAWLKNPFWCFAFIVALCLGWYTERNKRYIFMSRTVVSIAPRLGLWAVVLLISFAASVYVCWAGVVNSNNFVGVAILCLSPMAVISMVENAAISKLPIVKPVSAALENFLERMINSKAEKECDANRQQIEQALEPIPSDKREAQLWLWWQEELRHISGERRARRLFDRGSQMTRPWDNTLKDDARQKGLIALLSYTRVISGGKTALSPLAWPQKAQG